MPTFKPAWSGRRCGRSSAPRLGSLGHVFFLYVGGPLAIQGDITIGELIAFTTLIGYLTSPLRGMSFILSLVKRSQASSNGSMPSLPPPDRPDLPRPAPPPYRPCSFKPNVPLPEPETPALESVLEVPAGSTLGVFGPTASRKSTLLSLLARLYNPPRTQYSSATWTSVMWTSTGGVKPRHSSLNGPSCSPKASRTISYLVMTTTRSWPKCSGTQRWSTTSKRCLKA